MKSDVQVRHDVIAELDGDHSINSRQIGVTVKDGVVTLGGRVNSYKEKKRAVTAVNRLWGVKGVVKHWNKPDFLI